MFLFKSSVSYVRANVSWLLFSWFYYTYFYLFVLLKGGTGPAGYPGPKGEPGESTSAPQVVVSPSSRTVVENQTALFYCLAGGNPKPKISWSKLNGSGTEKSKGQQNKLEIKRSTYSDSGKYVCAATNVLGQDRQVVQLLVEGEI